LITTVVDVGPPADWVKVNVRETVSVFVYLFVIFFFPRNVLLDMTELLSIFCWDPDYFHCICAQKDCFEVYALVPGLLREEVSIL
jgi:hypothetical protein